MRLPVPNEAEVAEFAELYQREYGVELSSAEAFEIATKVVQLYYIKAYAVHSLCKEEWRE